MKKLRNTAFRPLLISRTAYISRKIVMQWVILLTTLFNLNTRSCHLAAAHQRFDRRTGRTRIHRIAAAQQMHFRIL
jgi:hypothetical protein